MKGLSNQVVKRLLTFVLCVSLALGAVPVVSADNSTKAAAISGVVYESGFVARWDSFFSDRLVAVENFSSALATITKADLWSELDYVMQRIGWGGHGSLAELQRKVAVLEGYLYPGVILPLGPDPNWTPGKDNCWLLRFVLGGLLGDFDFEVVQHVTYGWVIQEVNSGLILCNSRGAFPYYYEDVSDPDAGTTSSSLGGQWIPYSQVDWRKTNVLTEYSLYDLGYDLQDIGQDNDVVDYKRDGDSFYKYIRSAWTAGSFGDYYVYCDSVGNPYVSRVDVDAWAQDDKNDYYVDGDDGEISNGQLIDVDTSTVWFPDGTLNFINNLVYDESQKTYYVDASSSYDIDNNYYYTYNYHYEYHIDYTSITYIGQTEEYNEVYEYYYQLPDGRSSADLTAEELQALNTQIDVLPYIRSADDTSIRALYHFDGDTRDSSYWSHLGEFKWNEGASITYMDAGAFNGALYLSENAHDFGITLPSILGSGDWTIQWRYYQSHTLTPSADSYITVGGLKVMSWNGASLLSASGSTVFSAITPGVWNEVALMCKEGKMYCFLNGVLVRSLTTSPGVLGDAINFHFGDQQQTYKYFDELRVTNKALYPLEGYDCSSVPFDTNLSLVLPDSKLPVADEYWSIKSSHTNLFDSVGLSNWVSTSPSDWSSYSKANLTEYASFSLSSTNWSSFFDGPVLSGVDKFSASGFSDWVASMNETAVSFYSDVDGSSFIATKSSVIADESYSRTAYVPVHNDSNGSKNIRSLACMYPYGFNFYCGGFFKSGSNSTPTVNAIVTPGQKYTLSMVAANGEVGSYTFSIPSTPSGNVVDRSFTFNGYTIGFSWVNNRYPHQTTADCYRLIFRIVPTAFGANNKFVYLELVEGSSTDLTAEFVSSVVAMDKDDLNTPSLAVRTDLNITGYQLGGVRPSLPTKGLVWALVEAGRISSLQIYNGQAWEEVDGRIWTGSRWVPYYAYDVLLLKDMWDIVEADPSLNPIYTEAGFWKWLQEAWGEMMKKLDQIAAGSGGSGSGSGETKSFWNRIADAFTSGLTALIEGVFALITEILKTLLSLVTDLLSFLFNFVSETVLGGISDFFSAFTDGTLFEGFQSADEDGNTTTQLPEGVGAVFADFSGMISALPAELLGVLVFGIGLLFFLAVIKLF